MNRRLRTALTVTALSGVSALVACAQVLGLDVPTKIEVARDAGADTNVQDAAIATKDRAPCANIDETEDVSCSVQGCSGTKQRTCLRDGYSDYSACACAGWRDIPPPPDGFEGRRNSIAVWTGEEVLVWGGFGDAKGILGDGAAFSTVTNTWRRIKPSPLRGRYRGASAWTGSELVIWGGLAETSPRVIVSDGAAYNPISDTWRMLPQSPIAERSDPFSAFDVASNSVVIWGGEFESGAFARDGALLRLETGRFELTPAPPASVSARTPLAVLAASTVVMWDSPCTAPCSGSIAFTPSSGVWSKPKGLDPSFSTGGEPDAITCGLHGQEAIFWGGYDAGSAVMKGARFANNVWTTMPSPPSTVIEPAFYTLFCLAGSPGLIAGFNDTHKYINGRSALLSGTTWQALPLGAPMNRTTPIVVAMGRELFVWGGFDLSKSNGVDFYLRDGKILRLDKP